MDRRLPRQNFPLNLPTNRRLCSTVGGRIVEGWAAHCSTVSAARSRAATMTNLARSSLALVLHALFGAAKSCALVNLFMICPRWSASGQPNDESDSASDHGHLMASVRTRSFSHPLPGDWIMSNLQRIGRDAAADLMPRAVLPAEAAACICGGAARSNRPGRPSSRPPSPTLHKRVRPSRAIVPRAHSGRLCWRP